MTLLSIFVLCMVTIVWVLSVLKVALVSSEIRIAFCVIGTVALWVFGLIGLGLIGLSLFMVYKCST